MPVLSEPRKRPRIRTARKALATALTRLPSADATTPAALIRRSRLGLAPTTVIFPTCPVVDAAALAVLTGISSLAELMCATKAASTGRPRRLLITSVPTKPRRRPACVRGLGRQGTLTVQPVGQVASPPKAAITSLALPSKPSRKVAKTESGLQTTTLPTGHVSLVGPSRRVQAVLRS